MEVLLADEYGFCFGVERAVEMVEDALDEEDWSGWAQLTRRTRVFVRFVRLGH